MGERGVQCGKAENGRVVSRRKGRAAMDPLVRQARRRLSCWQRFLCISDSKLT